MLRLVPVLIATGCVIPFGLPPSRTEIGYGHTRDGGETRIAVGASVGSLVPAKDAAIELGGGLLVDRRSPIDPMDPGGIHTETSIGGYVDAGWAVLRTTHTRVVAGARYERFRDGPIAQAVNLRVDAELLGHTETSSSGTGGCTISTGGAYGNGGIGAYLETGPAQFTDDSMGWTATAGVSLRLPAWGAVVVALPCGNGGGHHGSYGSSGGGSLHLSGG